MNTVQRKMARHALGLDGERKRSYRNRYFASIDTPGENEWNDLCRRGLAMREKGGDKLVHFYLTDEGARQALDEGEILDPEDFPALPSEDRA
ncbi:hypothetical protein JEY40_24850 [Bradyrhizobium japonicum]|uniref:hypothetical protein n=1 Tax=Bradyrhizobium japonicum TaxID=375 RepID=UPI00200C8093|nr:hypothetical protein [Bradyrhizobium japonicum]UQD69248.1 hypothetical protein JEY40_24850 [Bradyrhizobium japonicum]WAX24511.1 hypothetical protein [Bradyrhizobium phage ppBjS10J-1]